MHGCIIYKIMCTASSVTPCASKSRCSGFLLPTGSIIKAKIKSKEKTTQNVQFFAENKVPFMISVTREAATEHERVYIRC